jgi:hypothetical protein
MGTVRFDQYERPRFQTILASIGLWSVTIVSMLLAFFCTLSYISSFDNKYIMLISAFIIAGGTTSYAMYKRHKQYIATYQERRDQAAIKIFNAAMSSSYEKFSVFLRPFYTTDKIIDEEVVTTYTTQPNGVLQANTMVFTYPLEDTIVETFSRTMPIIALGKPGETFGVGRILVDEGEWRTAATKLIDRAALIIFQPSSRPGSKWEIEHIIHHRYLDKTVFIVPPYPGKWKDLLEDWDVLRKNMACSGIIFPEYKSDGLLFSIDEKGQYISEDLRLNSKTKLLESFIRLSSPVIRGRGYDGYPDSPMNHSGPSSSSC